MNMKQMAANYLENIKKHKLLNKERNQRIYKCQDSLGVGLMCCSPSLVSDDDLYYAPAGGDRPIGDLGFEYYHKVRRIFKREFGRHPSDILKYLSPERIKERMEDIVNNSGEPPRYIANQERLSFYLICVTDRETE